MKLAHAVAFSLSIVAPTAACGDNEPPGVLNPAREAYDTWVKIEPPGTVCGNDTQFKFWVNFSDTSDNLVVVLEPGGACWDFDSCTGRNGIRGAANVDGLPDDHIDLAPFISPFLQRFDDTNPSKDWNLVYVPYCTGDVHTGNKVVTYPSDVGGAPDVTFHHEGHRDMQAVVSWLDANFTHVPKMLVTGCSAGGVGALTNYYFLRKGVTAAQKGYLLDDSGPVFPTESYSKPMHMKIRGAWDLDSLQPEMPAGFTLEDMGTINTALADQFPDDRLATTYFRRDYNFSLYSYERFYPLTPEEKKAEIMRMWDADTQKLVALYDTRPNLYYFLPYWRNINDSHCTTLINFAGSDIEDQGLTLSGWVNDFIADRPVHSAMEAPVPGEDP